LEVEKTQMRSLLRRSTRRTVMIGMIARIDGAQTILNPDKGRHNKIACTVTSVAAMGVNDVVAQEYVCLRVDGFYANSLSDSKGGCVGLGDYFFFISGL